MLIRAATPTPTVTPKANSCLVLLYHRGYVRAGQKSKKKKSVPKRAATETQKTIVRYWDAKRLLLCTCAVYPLRASMLVWWVWYLAREYVAIHWQMQ
jgi:hypothetical protein